MPPQKIELFVDESGRFEEQSGGAQRRPSQLCGVIANAGWLSADKAREILGDAFRAIGRDVPRRVHAMELIDAVGSDKFDDLLRALVEALHRREAQPARIVHRERLSLGDRVSTVLALTAELTLRAAETWARAHEVPVEVRTVAGGIRLNPNEEPPRYIGEQEGSDFVYRYELHGRVRGGTVGSVVTLSEPPYKTANDKLDPRLQICDLLSFASYVGKRAVSGDTLADLRDLFGNFDFTLTRAPTSGRVDDLLADGSVGLALTVVAGLFREDPQAARPWEGRLVDALAALSSRSRDGHLLLLRSWVEDVVEHERADARALLSWIDGKLLDPLAATLGARANEVAAHRLAFAKLDLTTKNHMGDLEGAARSSARIDQLFPPVAAHFEHAELVVAALVHQAVHLTDALDTERACAQAKGAVEYYDTLAGLLHDALPAVFPSEVRSDLRARALGTWLQAEVSSGVPERARSARTISDRAIAEFTSDGDRARQFQYRSQLEAVAGEFAEARAWLAKSLGCGAGNDDIGGSIVALKDSDRGFPLLHWTRIAGLAARDGHRIEVEGFLSAAAHGLQASSWWSGNDVPAYPTVGIQRRLAVVAAFMGDDGLVRRHITAMRNAMPKPQGLTMQAIELAALFEAAALVALRAPKVARTLLEEGEGSARAILGRLRSASAGSLPSLHQETGRWSTALQEQVAALQTGKGVQEASRRLVACAARIPH